MGQPEQPFEAGAAYPVRCPFLAAGESVEQPTDGPDDTRLKPARPSQRQLLLVGRAEAQEQDVGSRVVDAFQDAPRFVSFEIAGFGADGVDVGPATLDTLPRPT